MRVITTEIVDVKILEPRVFSDARGFFYESYNQNVIADALNVHDPFVQDNHSHSIQGVLRGLHYQLKNPQGKLVRVTSGEVFDVAVDMRKSSSTFGKWVGLRLSAENRRMFWIPPGFAHGFLVLSPRADFLYKTTQFYDPTSEHSLRWDDPDLAITWPLQDTPNLSPKDSQGKLLKEAPLFP
jgi:dTDP-4-dehydrorhamnose 3,5-epimerase